MMEKSEEDAAIMAEASGGNHEAKSIVPSAMLLDDETTKPSVDADEPTKDAKESSVAPYPQPKEGSRDSSMDYLKPMAADGPGASIARKGGAEYLSPSNTSCRGVPQPIVGKTIDEESIATETGATATPPPLDAASILATPPPLPPLDAVSTSTGDSLPSTSVGPDDPKTACPMSPIHSTTKNEKIETTVAATLHDVATTSKDKAANVSVDINNPASPALDADAIAANESADHVVHVKAASIDPVDQLMVDSTTTTSTVTVADDPRVVGVSLESENPASPIVGVSAIAAKESADPVVHLAAATGSTDPADRLMVRDESPRSKSVDTAGVLVNGDNDNDDDDHEASNHDGESTTEQDATSCNETMRKSKRKNKDGPPCRPGSAYNIFFKLERQRILEAHYNGAHGNEQEEDAAAAGAGEEGKKRPDTSGNVFSAVSKTVSERWKVLPAAVKEVYEKLAREQAKIYRVETEEYYKRIADGSSCAKAKDDNSTTGVVHTARGQYSSTSVAAPAPAPKGTDVAEAAAPPVVVVAASAVAESGAHQAMLNQAQVLLLLEQHQQQQQPALHMAALQQTTALKQQAALQHAALQQQNLYQQQAALQQAIWQQRALEQAVLQQAALEQAVLQERQKMEQAALLQALVLLGAQQPQVPVVQIVGEPVAAPPVTSVAHVIPAASTPPRDEVSLLQNPSREKKCAEQKTSAIAKTESLPVKAPKSSGRPAPVAPTTGHYPAAATVDTNAEAVRPSGKSKTTARMVTGGQHKRLLPRSDAATKHSRARAKVSKTTNERTCRQEREKRPLPNLATMQQSAAASVSTSAVQNDPRAYRHEREQREPPSSIVDLTRLVHPHHHYQPYPPHHGNSNILPHHQLHIAPAPLEREIEYYTYPQERKRSRHEPRPIPTNPLHEYYSSDDGY